MDVERSIMGGFWFARECVLGVSAFLSSFDLLCVHCGGLILKLSLTQESCWVMLLLNWKQPQHGEVWVSLSPSCSILFQDTPPLLTLCSQLPGKQNGSDGQAGCHPAKLYPDADRNRHLDTFQMMCFWSVHLFHFCCSGKIPRQKQLKGERLYLGLSFQGR